jgi:DNA-binding transcriptional regulator LsrR (DeoR family)
MVGLCELGQPTAYGIQKAPAVHAALSGGLVRGLVTHRALVELLVR